MKNFSLLLLIFLIFSCKDNTNPPSVEEPALLETSCSDFKNVEYLKDYEKVSDTSYIKSGNEPTHRITELKKDDKTLILFSEINLDNERKESYSILDTLQIKNLKQAQFITIGYCEMENSLMEEIIAIVDRTDKDTINQINKAWKANAENNKIENIENLKDIICLNEKKSDAL